MTKSKTSRKRPNSKARARRGTRSKRTPKVKRPPVEIVIAYVDQRIEVYLERYAGHLPTEQKDEVRQNAALRVFEAYDRIDVKKGWKAFVQNHCRGAVLDYLRGGKGFQESSWASMKPACDGTGLVKGEILRTRVMVKCERSSSGQGKGGSGEVFLDAEAIAGLFGIFAEAVMTEGFCPRWPLIARMARVDPEIHLVAKILLGFTQTELADHFGVSRERLSQRIREFFRRLDAPEFYHSPWIQQTIYAFGLSSVFNMDDEDHGVGWNLVPLDLTAVDSVSKITPHLRPVLIKTP